MLIHRKWLAWITGSVAGVLLLLPSSVVQGQDLRHVVEPKIPPSCIVLRARLTSEGWNLPAADESRLDTKRIQHALDHCRKGETVELAGNTRHNAFLTGPIRLTSGVTLRVDKGVILFASRNPRDYDIEKGVCGTVSPHGHACKALITVNHANNAAVMGGGVIDGRGGDTLLGQKRTWWDVADQALKGGLQNNFRMITVTASNNFTLYGIQLKDSPNFNVTFTGGNGFTAWGITISDPANGRNLDGIDIGQPFPVVDKPTTNVTVTHSFIHDGDDIVAAKAPSIYPTSHITISHDHFYTGHGVSIGSATTGGVSAVRVFDVSIDGAEYGLRIKSNVTLGGKVSNVDYNDVCIRSSPNPIKITSHYDSYGPGHEVYGSGTNHLPQFTNIHLNNIAIQGGGTITLDGLNRVHRLQVALRNVHLDHPAAYKLHVDHAAIRESGTNIPLAGDDVQVSRSPKKGQSLGCTDAFVPFPAPVTVRR